jgi:hypothetical protein
LNLPFTVTVTDLSPSTGQSVANGPVDLATGIHGHRVTKADGTPNEIRLTIDIKDSTGNAPDYPVLVDLSLATVWTIRPGTIILDPDGARLECPNASFIWHERDAQGNIVALNEEIGYRYGTYAAYVGATPDPDNPGHVKPVWGPTEAITLTLFTVDPNGDPSPATVFNATYDIHPEPSKPDHLACLDGQGQPCPDVFPFWTGYLVAPQGNDPVTGHALFGPNFFQEYNAYVLLDALGNQTFGYTDTSPKDTAQPASGKNEYVNFADQTTTGPSFNAYVLATRWTDNPWPSGDVPVTLQVNYPADPDWPAGTVSKTITYQFDSSATHVLARYPNYDLIRPDGTKGYTDGPAGTFPISVSPGATTGSLPKTENGDTQRLVLLAYSGQSISGTLPLAEPYSTGNRTWMNTGTTWSIVMVLSDPHLEVTDRPNFKLSLIDNNARPVNAGAFRVWTCPRFDHESGGASCSTYVDSDAQGVVSSVTLTTGYIGLELLSAPATPGTYYVLVESLGQTYKIRRESDLVTDRSVGPGEFKGAFSLCVVQGAEIVDENFKVADRLIYVATPKLYRVRYIGASSQGLPTSASIDTKNSDNTPADSIPSVALTRVGFSNLAYSDLFTLNPPPGGSLRASRTALTAGSLNAGTGVTGLLEATVSTQTVKRDTEPVPVVELTLFDYNDHQISRDAQRQAGYLMCPNVDDDLLRGQPDYTKSSFPLIRASGYALNLRERQDTVRVTVTRTAEPLGFPKLMLREGETGLIKLFQADTGLPAVLPFEVPWDQITQQNVSFFAETTVSRPVELTLSLEDGPTVPPDNARFHGCDGSYFFISGAGHDDSSSHYITGFQHSFQSQKLCGFADLNVSTGSQLSDINVVQTLFSNGINGVSPSDPAYQKVQQVLSATATARGTGRAAITGYSYGATVAAAAAVEAARQGSPFAFCGVIGPPLGTQLFASYQSACGTALFKNIPGDAIQAPATDFELAEWGIILQFAVLQFSAPHFFYAQDLNDIYDQQRRDALIQEWNAAGALTSQCLASH